MNALNSIILEGNIVRPPVLKETPMGTPICTICIACNRAYKNGSDFVEEVSYFDIEAWGKMGEICAEKASTGRGVRVVGRLKQSRWQDEEGKSHSKITVIAEHLEYKPVFTKKGKEEKIEEVVVVEKESALTEEELIARVEAEEALVF